MAPTILERPKQVTKKKTNRLDPFISSSYPSEVLHKISNTSTKSGPVSGLQNTIPNCYRPGFDGPHFHLHLLELDPEICSVTPWSELTTTRRAAPWSEVAK